jgi:multisubunit Na+/H+ antiporter MnhE subunit
MHSICNDDVLIAEAYGAMGCIWGRVQERSDHWGWLVLSLSSAIYWRPWNLFSHKHNPILKKNSVALVRAGNRTLTTRTQIRSTFFYITYINSVRTSQKIQYISVLQLGTLTTRPQRRSTFFYITYINSVRTSQKIQYISVLQLGTLTTRPQRRSTFFYITYINSVRTSQKIQYISVLQPGTLTTRPQRRSNFFYITYINSVRTSQEAQYISVM